MSNPFLRAKQQNGTMQPQAAVMNQSGARHPPVNTYSAPPQGFAQPPQAFVPAPQIARGIPPPPTVSAMTQQMANLSLNPQGPPPSTMPPPPTGNVQSSYLTTKGRYQVPSNAYQYASAAPTDNMQSQHHTAEGGFAAASTTPAYIGQGTTYDSTSPAPACADPSTLPDEEYVKLTYEIAPNSNSLQGMSGMPFGGIFRPMAVDGGEIPVVSFGSSGVQRCRRCRLYVNPFIQFLDGGRRWKCNMCGFINDVPNDYFSPLDMNGKRVDLASRPELLKGQVEFVAGAEYCLRPPVFPTYLFVIDVSYQSVASGMVATICSSIKNSLDGLLAMCNNSTVNVAFMTFDSSIHFYRLSEGMTARQLVVSEIEEVFLPVPRSLLINLADNRSAIEAFLDALPTTVVATKTVDTCTGNAIQFAAKLLEDCGGKILVFQASMPSYGVGKLKLRETPAMLGTEAEKDLLLPGTPYYRELGAILVEKQISVDFFLGSAQYADAATISSLCQTTGGQFFFYPSFHQDGPQAEALYGDLFHVLTRETGFEAVYRVRVPQGAKVSAFHGNFTLSNGDLMVLPVCHADTTIVLEFSLEAVLSMPTFPVQGALLYTNSSGERRIRVHTMSLPVSNILAHLFERVNQDVIAAVTLQQSIRNLTLVGPSVTRQKIHQVCLQLIKRAKAQETNPTQAIPEKMNLIPLYLSAMQKCGICRGGHEQKSDSRVYAMQQACQSGLDVLMKILYPSLMVLHNLPAESCTYADDVDALPETTRVYGERNIILPPFTNLSLNALTADGMYLIDDGLSLWLLLGNQVSTTEMTNLFGVPSLDGYDVSNMCLPVLQTELNKKVHDLIDELRMDRPYFCPLHIVRVVDPSFANLKWRFVEDRDTFQGANYSYQEYVQLVTGNNPGY